MKPRLPVLPEELRLTSISFKSAFWIVVAAHLIIILSVCASPIITAARANDDKKFLHEPEYVGIPETKSEPSPTPTPSPTPIPSPTPTPSPTPKQTTPKSPDWPRSTSAPVVTHTPHLTKEYIVKHGDTFYSIVKKYKLNYATLQRINNIKDPSKLTIGQHLKFTN